MNLSGHLVAALRRHLASGKPVSLPAGGDLLWKWFIDLSAARSWHSVGPNPIAWIDIAAYCSLTGIRMSERHLAIIRALDAAYLEHYHKTAGAPDKPAAADVSSRPLSPALFDAMFG